MVVGVGGVEGVHSKRRPIAGAGAGGIAGGSAGASRAADLERAVELELLDDNVRAVDEQRRALRDDDLVRVRVRVRVRARARARVRVRVRIS